MMNLNLNWLRTCALFYMHEQKTFISSGLVCNVRRIQIGFSIFKWNDMLKEKVCVTLTHCNFYFFLPVAVLMEKILFCLSIFSMFIHFTVPEYNLKKKKQSISYLPKLVILYVCAFSLSQKTIKIWCDMQIFIFFVREKCTCNWTKQRKKIWANKGQNTSAAEMKNIRLKILKMPKQGKNLAYSACQQQPSHLSDSCIGKL